MGVGSELTEINDLGDRNHIIAGTLNGIVGIWSMRRKIPVFAKKIEEKGIITSIKILNQDAL